MIHEHFDTLEPNKQVSQQNSVNPASSFDEAWLQVKQALSEVLSKDEFSAWINPLIAKKTNDKEVTLLVPNAVFYQGIIEKYLPFIEKTKNDLGLDSIFFKIEIENSELDIHTKYSEEVVTNDGLGGDIMPNQNARKTGAFSSGGSSSPHMERRQTLNPNYLFTNFVSGQSNRFAQAAAEAVANNPGLTYNPLFIYGGTGLGKTHLLQAVGNFILKQNPGYKVTYISSESFMNEMIYSLRFNKMPAFREKYRHCDVFLVDDIQFISNKGRTQEEFFHTFNALYETKKQMVLTSDMFPQDIPDIEERLRNRFQWGLIADIQPPDEEHRIAILYEKAAQMGLQIDQDVLSYIANHSKKNVRELEGALHRISAFALMHGRGIDLDLAVETFQNVPSNTGRKVNIDLIQKIVADHFKLKVIELKSKKRLRALTVPRQIAMYLSRELTNSSYPEIGDKFGGKDHTTVMHAVKKIAADKKDLNIKADLDALRRKLEQLC